MTHRPTRIVLFVLLSALGLAALPCAAGAAPSFVDTQVKANIDKSQREYFLQEQLKAIQKELGQADDKSIEVQDLRGKIEAAGMPPPVPRPQHILGRNAGGEVQHEDRDSSGSGTKDRRRRANHLVVRVGRQNQDAAPIG